jgi:hypothetical protein
MNQSLCKLSKSICRHPIPFGDQLNLFRETNDNSAMIVFSNIDLFIETHCLSKGSKE